MTAAPRPPLSEAEIVHLETWLRGQSNYTGNAPLLKRALAELRALRAVADAVRRVDRWIGYTIDIPGLETCVRVCRDSHCEAAEAIRDLKQVLAALDATGTENSDE
jgi:hypothetical protein